MDDACELIDRPVARFGAEDARTVVGLARRRHRPAFRTAPRDRPHVGAPLFPWAVAHQPLEIERDVAALARGDQVGARYRDRIACILRSEEHTSELQSLMR